MIEIYNITLKDKTNGKENSELFRRAKAAELYAEGILERLNPKGKQNVEIIYSTQMVTELPKELKFTITEDLVLFIDDFQNRLNNYKQIKKQKKQ